MHPQPHMHTRHACHSTGCPLHASTPYRVMALSDTSSPSMRQHLPRRILSIASSCVDPHARVWKRSWRDSFWWILRMASATSTAMLSCVMRVHFLTRSLDGIESVTTTSSKGDASILSSAGPLNRPCVAKANTRRAPCFRSSRAASHNVPAVSIISSTMMTSEPLTDPTRSILSILLAPARCLMSMAMPTSSMPREISPSWNLRAR
mmetsp:Transcript_27776/g.69357  ORF Transcript_27776/g.69357 Transcript_27776/m.69357 type:complete len:206 (+) Transcript_27776:110-727(+)